MHYDDLRNGFLGSSESEKFWVILAIEVRGESMKRRINAKILEHILTSCKINEYG